MLFFFFQAEDGIRDIGVTGVQTCALPILGVRRLSVGRLAPSEQVLQGYVAPAPALELGEGDVHGDLLGPGGETTLSSKGVQVVGYLDQRLLGEILGVGVYATSIATQARP